MAVTNSPVGMVGTSQYTKKHSCALSVDIRTAGEGPEGQHLIGMEIVVQFCDWLL